MNVQHLLYIALIVFFVVSLIDKTSQCFATSPAFYGQEIMDDQQDWINMTNKEPFSQGARSTDILAADYFSDGKVLNATLWLYFPFKDHPDITYSEVNYGMLIDADFNRNTGYGGIDYLFQISWQNNTDSWTKTLWAFSPTGEQKTLDIKGNYTGFFEKGKAYVILPLDLGLIHFPAKYKVTFYAETKKGGTSSSITDFVKTVAIPPLEISISPSPQSLTLRPGDSKVIELRVNSSQGFEPTVFLSTANQSGDIKSDIKFNKLRIPSYGTATTPVTISASKNAASRPYTLFIFANTIFPPENLITEFIPRKATIDFPIPQTQNASQNVISQSTMRIAIEEPLTIEDKISGFWNKLGNPITFFYGVMAGISPWIYSKLKEKSKKK